MCGPPFYIGAPFTARVVDEAGKPVRGAVVVAIWQCLALNIHPSTRGPILAVREAVTNANGQFRMPGGGPWRRPLSASFSNRDPLVCIYAPGYRCLGRENHVRPWSSLRVVRASDLDAQQLVLDRAVTLDDRKYALACASAIYDDLIRAEIRDARRLPELPHLWTTWLSEWSSLPREVRNDISPPVPVREITGDFCGYSPLGCVPPVGRNARSDVLILFSGSATEYDIARAVKEIEAPKGNFQPGVTEVSRPGFIRGRPTLALMLSPGIDPERRRSIVQNVHALPAFFRVFENVVPQDLALRQDIPRSYWPNP